MDEASLEARLKSLYDEPWPEDAEAAAGVVELAAQALRYCGFGRIASSAAALLRRAIEEDTDSAFIAATGAPILLVHAVEAGIIHLEICKACCVVVSATCHLDPTRRKLLLDPEHSIFATAIATHTLHGDAMLREAVAAVTRLAAFDSTHSEACRTGVPAWAIGLLRRTDPAVTAELRVRRNPCFDLAAGESENNLSMLPPPCL